EIGADLIVLGSTVSRPDVLSRLLDLDRLDVRVVGVHQFEEYAFGRVPVDHLTPEWFMAVLHLYQPPYSRLVKRSLDVVAAGFGLVLLAPLMAAVCLIMRAGG